MSEAAVEIRECVFVIPCSGAKLDHAAPARELYTGSFFREALAASLAEVDADSILVLSALHGLVRLEDVLEPYNVRMGDAGSISPERVREQALELGIDFGTEVFACLPSSYFEVLDEALRELDVFAAPVFEGNRGIGDQKSSCRIIRETN